MMKLVEDWDGWFWFERVGANLAATAIGIPQITETLEAAIRSSHYPEINDTLFLVEYRVSTERNEWGHNIFASVNYFGSYISSWGGKAVDDVIEWQCYAD